MKHTLSFMVWAILAILLPLQMAQAAAPPTELQKRLQNLPDISDIKPMQSPLFILMSIPMRGFICAILLAYIVAYK